MRCTTVSVRRDEQARTQRTLLRYELDSTTDGDSAAGDVLEREWLLHWHSQGSFARMVTDAGLEVRAVLRPDGTASEPDDSGFTFLLGIPERSGSAS